RDILLPSTPHLKATNPQPPAKKKDRRWDSDFLTLRALLQTNALGRVVEFASHFDRHKPSLAGAKAWKSRPEPGGGAIYDLGTHLLDQAVLLFGLPRKLTAFLGSQRQGIDAGGYEDSCTVLLHYDGGMLATLKVAVVSPETRQLRFWVRGERGSFKKYHADPQEGHLAEGKSPDDAGFGIEPDEWAGEMFSNQSHTFTFSFSFFRANLGTIPKTLTHV
ncbi:MAG: hypothetical protein Q9193_007169, partial [Seirophora villosa]